MILTIDIGNSNTVVGVIDEKKIYFKENIATSNNYSSIEYAMILKEIFEFNQIDPEDIEGAILSSVVPGKNYFITTAVKKLTGVECKIVTRNMKTGLTLAVDHPSQLGADIIVTSVAVAEEYHLPAAVIDLGTATTIFVVNSKKELCGGVIMPGVSVSFKSLNSSTAQLPGVAIKEAGSVISKNTEECIRSGILYGHAGMIDSILIRMESELGESLTAIATGGLSRYIIPLCGHHIVQEDYLLLKGLLKLYRLNE